MKKITIPILFLLFSFSSVFGQNFDTSNIVRNGESPAFFRNQIIIKFNPAFIDTSVINDTSVLSGIVEDFINFDLLTLLGLDQHPLLSGPIAELPVYKIHKKLTSYNDESRSRMGYKVTVPKFWSTLLVEWDDKKTGFDYGDAIDTLNKMPGVIEYAVPNYVAVVNSGANDPLYNFNSSKPNAAYQANLHDNTNLTTPLNDGDINIEPAWDISNGGYSEIPVKVGIYDTGINWRHEDLSEDGTGDWNASRVKDGWDYFNNEHCSTQVTPDRRGHGTSVAGIIGAIRNNSVGIAGISGGDASVSSYGADLYSMKIFNNADENATNDKVLVAPLSVVADAIREGASDFLVTPSGHYYSMDVMSCSWQAKSESNFPSAGLEFLRDVIIYAFRNNVSMSFSAGNGYGQYTTYPASYRDDFLMKVGATDKYGIRWLNGFYGSNYGYDMDFSAPGDAVAVNTIAHNDNEGYFGFSATSAACPHAAGVAALMLGYIRQQGSAAPNPLAPEDIEQIIERTSKNSMDNNPYDYNQDAWGLINAGEALEAIQLPAYQVKHYVDNVNYNSAITVGTNTSVELNEFIGTDANPGAFTDLKAGTYEADVYKVSTTFNITQPSPRGVIGVWKLSSLSTLYGKHDAFNPGINAGEDEVITWNNSQTTAIAEGYIYHIKKDALGNTVNEWLPANARNLSGTGTLALTAYTVSPWSSGVGENAMSDNIKIYPNPNSGKFNIEIKLFERADVKVDLLDVTGKIVCKGSSQQELPGMAEYSINTSSLAPGIYFCRISAGNDSYLRKVIVSK